MDTDLVNSDVTRKMKTIIYYYILEDDVMVHDDTVYSTPWSPVKRRFEKARYNTNSEWHPSSLCTLLMS